MDPKYILLISVDLIMLKNSKSKHLYHPFWLIRSSLFSAFPVTCTWKCSDVSQMWGWLLDGSHSKRFHHPRNDVYRSPAGTSPSKFVETCHMSMNNTSGKYIFNMCLLDYFLQKNGHDRAWTGVAPLLRAVGSADTAGSRSLWDWFQQAESFGSPLSAVVVPLVESANGCGIQGIPETVAEGTLMIL